MRQQDILPYVLALSASAACRISPWGEILKQRATIDEPQKTTLSIHNSDEIPVSADYCVHSFTNNDEG